MSVLRTIAKGLGYLLFTLMCTALFVLLTFPTERAKEFVETHASNAIKGDVRIGELELSGIGGAELREIVVRLPDKAPAAGPAEEGGEGEKKKRPPKMVRAERIAADVAVWPLIFGGEKVATFEAELQGGTLTGGRAAQAEDGALSLTIEQIDGVDIGAGGLMKSLSGFDVRGVLAGRFDVARGLQAHELSGTIDLELSGAKVANPVVPTRQLGPIQLADIELGTLAAQIRIGSAEHVGLASKARRRGSRKKAETTLIRFQDVGAPGAEVEVQFDDKSLIRLAPGVPMSNAGLDIHMAVRFTDKFLDKKVKAKDGTFSQPNKILRMAMKQDPTLKSAIRDGVLGLTCRGTLKKPNCRPEPPRVRGGFKSRKLKFEATEEEPEPEPKPKAPKPRAEAKKSPRARPPVTPPPARPSDVGRPNFPGAKGGARGARRTRLDDRSPRGPMEARPMPTPARAVRDSRGGPIGTRVTPPTVHPRAMDDRGGDGAYDEDLGEGEEEGDDEESGDDEEGDEDEEGDDEEGDEDEEGDDEESGDDEEGDDEEEDE